MDNTAIKISCSICSFEVSNEKVYNVMNNYFCSRKCVKVFRSSLPSKKNDGNRRSIRADYGGQSAY